jgi:hypothetical protein
MRRRDTQSPQLGSTGGAVLLMLGTLSVVLLSTEGKHLASSAPGRQTAIV